MSQPERNGMAATPLMQGIEALLFVADAPLSAEEGGARSAAGCWGTDPPAVFCACVPSCARVPLSLSVDQKQNEKIQLNADTIRASRNVCTAADE